MRKAFGIVIGLATMDSMAASPPPSLPDDGAVIQAIIDANCKDAERSNPPQAAWLSNEALVLAPDSIELQMGPDNLDAVAERQLVQRLGKPSKLPAGLKDCGSLRLKSEAEVSARISSRARLPIDQMPPLGSFMMHLSLPGYSAEGNTAIVYLTVYCASLCGEGEYVMLRKTAMGWQVERHERAYIS